MLKFTEGDLALICDALAIARADTLERDRSRQLSGSEIREFKLWGDLILKIENHLRPHDERYWRPAEDMPPLQIVRCDNDD